MIYYEEKMLEKDEEVIIEIEKGLGNKAIQDGKFIKILNTKSKSEL